MRPKVVYWNNIPSPYIVDRFNALAERDNLEFEAWFNERIEQGRSWIVDETTWKFKYRYVPRKDLLGKTLKLPPMPKEKPDVVISLYADPIFVIGWFLNRLRHTKVGFWVPPTFDSWIKRTRIKNALKRFMFARTDSLLTISEDGKVFIERYGGTNKQIKFLPHSINVDAFRAGSELTKVEYDSLRKYFGLSGITFIYVGRLWKGKGIDYLIDAFSLLEGQVETDVTLFIVGDGPEESKLKERCAQIGLKRVVFGGFHQVDTLPKLYGASDVFVFPTLGDPYGLVVDEAMVCGLPVISTTEAGEITSRITNEVNGFIVPPSNTEALAKAMLSFTENPELISKMGKQSINERMKYTPEWWANEFEAIIFEMLSI